MACNTTKPSALVIVVLQLLAFRPCSAFALVSPRPPFRHGSCVASAKKRVTLKASSRPSWALKMATATVDSKVKGFPAPTAPRPSVDSGLRYRSDDWLGNALSIPKSFLLRRIRFHLGFNTALAAVVVAVYKFTKFKDYVSMPSVAHSLLGSFMGLLLVFRTNSAYSRFYEARGVWSKVMSTCRNTALSAVTYIAPHSPKSVKRMVELLAAFPDALAYTCLAGRIPLPSSVESVLGQPASSSNRQGTNLEPASLVCLDLHEAINAAAVESPTYEDNLDESLHLNDLSHDIHGLVSALTDCDKILRTPVPLSYSRHTSRFLTLWCGTLPFTLVKQFGFLTLPVVMAACWCLFGIEEIGHLIEQPFVGHNIDSGLEVADAPDDAEDRTFSTKRGKKTLPYDIGLPVCALARQVRDEVLGIAAAAEAKKPAAIPTSV